MVLTRCSIHDVAPVTGNDENEQATSMSREERLMHRASMWRAIILSSMGKTLFPYSKYIRTLNVQGLEDLLEQIQIIPGAKSKSRLSELVFHTLAEIDIF